jgi:hypothetical protein
MDSGQYYYFIHQNLLRSYSANLLSLNYIGRYEACICSYS